MIVPILIFSGILISIGFSVTEKNAQYLLSGYNTMSEAEREKFDIKRYIKLFRNFHLFVGLSLLVIGLLLYNFVDQQWSEIFIGTYPILAYVYLIWKGIQFSNKNNRRQKITAYLAMCVLLIVFALIVFEFKNA